MEGLESQFERNRQQLSPEMQEHLKFYNSHREKLIESAAKAREGAVSHRGFHVGCSILTVKKKRGTYFYDSYNAANYTPIKKDPPETGPNKLCAERNAAQTVLNKGEKLIYAIVTISNQTEKTRTGDPTAHDALHPCPDCRMMMRGLLALGILREDSIICSVNDSDKGGRLKTEEQTVRDLLAQYKKDPPLQKDPTLPELL